jgi:hypothetical protein
MRAGRHGHAGRLVHAPELGMPTEREEETRMKVLIEKFWKEPAVAIAVLTAVANAVLILIVAAVDATIDGADIAVAASALGLTGVGGAATRSQVVSKNKGRERNDPPPANVSTAKGG